MTLILLISYLFLLWLCCSMSCAIVALFYSSVHLQTLRYILYFPLCNCQCKLCCTLHLRKLHPGVESWSICDCNRAKLEHWELIKCQTVASHKWAIIKIFNILAQSQRKTGTYGWGRKQQNLIFFVFKGQQQENCAKGRWSCSQASLCTKSIVAALCLEWWSAQSNV